MIFKDSVFTAL